MRIRWARASTVYAESFWTFARIIASNDSGHEAAVITRAALREPIYGEQDDVRENPSAFIFCGHWRPLCISENLNAVHSFGITSPIHPVRGLGCPIVSLPDYLITIRDHSATLHQPVQDANHPVQDTGKCKVELCGQVIRAHEPNRCSEPGRLVMPWFLEPKGQPR